MAKILPPPQQVAERAADEQQRPERQQVGLDDPLLRREPGVEVVADRGQRDVDHGAVEEHDGGAEHARDQRQALGAGVGHGPSLTGPSRLRDDGAEWIRFRSAWSPAGTARACARSWRCCDRSRTRSSLAVDSRRAEPVLSACADLVDRPYLVDFTGTAEHYTAWLHHQCRGDWILRLDDDEVPGAALLEQLPELVRDRRHALQLLPRRHLYPTRERYIASHPWFPDYQPRLVRNVPGAVDLHGPAAFLHRGARASAGACRTRPIYHLRYAASPAAERLATALERERATPGLTTEAYAVNALALPEHWTGVETARGPRSRPRG